MRTIGIVAVIGIALVARGLVGADAPKKKAASKKTAPPAMDDTQKGEALHNQAVKLRTQATLAHQRAQKSLEEAGKEQEAAERLFQEAANLERQARILLKEDPEAFELIQKSHREQRAAEVDEIRVRSLTALSARKANMAKVHGLAARTTRSDAGTETDPQAKAKLEKAAAALEAEAKEETEEAQKLKAEADKYAAAAKDCREKAKKDQEAALKIDPSIEKKTAPDKASIEKKAPPETPPGSPPAGKGAPEAKTT